MWFVNISQTKRIKPHSIHEYTHQMWTFCERKKSPGRLTFKLCFQKRYICPNNNLTAWFNGCNIYEYKIEIWTYRLIPTKRPGWRIQFCDILEFKMSLKHNISILSGFQSFSDNLFKHWTCKCSCSKVAVLVKPLTARIDSVGTLWD